VRSAYESTVMHEATGETLRPGGFKLTQKAVEFCALRADSKVLDVGCGRGATIGYLYRHHSIAATGVDPSQKLLLQAKAKHPYATFLKGSGEALVFDEERFDCVFAECTLSLMNDLSKALQEVHRVLGKQGWFVISDVYAKNPSEIVHMEQMSIHSCMRGIHCLESLKERLEALGFTIMLLEDCSDLLKALMVRIIFEHGSMERFWRKASQAGETQTCCFSQMLKKCKPGYFILIAKKGEE
jgi:ubiquinone/menaquinone biosynthesis C-methylase UbiE